MPTESLAVVRTGVAPRVSATRRGEGVRAAFVPTAEGDGEVGGVVDGYHAGVAVFALQQGSDEADGGAGGEEEHDAVALVPGPVEGFFAFALVEASVGPDVREVGGVAAAVRGGGY